MRIPAGIALAAVFTAHLATAAVVAKSVRIGKTTVQYKVVLPEKYDSTKASGEEWMNLTRWLSA
jgi:hypothetical protein